MKQGTTQHRKFLRLRKALDLRNWQVVGLLESIWLFAAQNAEDGQLVPRCTLDDIACFLEWESADMSRVIDALVDAKWIDRAPSGALTIHDWHDHMPHYLRERLRKRNNGTLPESCQPSRKVSLTQPNPTKPNPTEITSADAECPPGFSRFWGAWPRGERKTGKKKCLGIWRRMGLEKHADAVVKAVEGWKKTESWTKERGQYVPMPETWLNGGRWEEVPDAAKGSSREPDFFVGVQ